MDDSLFAPQEVADIYNKLRLIYSSGKCRDAWEQALVAWGHPDEWRAPEQLVLGARMAYQLGIPRTADAFILVAARRHRHHPLVRYFYARHILGRRGPLAALEYMRPLGERLSEDAKLQSDWLLIFAEIHISYRDWGTAEDFIRRAREVEPANTWASVIAAELLENRDDYVAALREVESLALAQRPYRPAVQSAAHLYVLLGRENDAIALLSSLSEQIQSVGALLYLQGLHRERAEHEVAAQYLRKARACVPEGRWRVDKRIAYAEFERCYAQGDYDNGVAILRKMHMSFADSLAKNIEASVSDGASRRASLDVPFIRQHHMTCAPATFTAIAQYWGHAFEQLDVAERICYDGTAATTERKWIAELGWVVHEFELDLEILCQLIDRDIPVGLATVEPGNAHMQAIIGYDLCKGVYLLRDPFVRKTGELLIEGAHKYYQSTGPRCIVYLPPDKAHLLDGIDLPVADLYEQYYVLQSALEENRREDAALAADALQAQAPEHRLTLWAQRSIAAYDKDLNKLLSVTDALIERFPSDLNILSAKAGLLGELGRDKDKIQFLQESIGSGLRHPYLLQLVVDELRYDNRSVDEALALSAEILKERPCDARALFAKAGILWDSQQFDRAFELYRFTVCLEDKHEGYAESYFKAGRILGRRDDVLTFLQEREKTLGALSGDPSVTLARVYSLIDREPDALKTIDAALKRHPTNAWLIGEALELLIFVRQFSDATALLESSRTRLTKVSYLEYCARIAAATGDNDCSVGYYKDVLASSPHHTGAVNALVRQEQRNGGAEAALATLNAYLKENPYSYVLRGIKLDLLSGLPVALRRPALAEMVDAFPSDIRVLLDAARADCADEAYAEAQVKVDAALSINRHDTDAMALSGYIAFQCGDYQTARSSFKDVIAFDVDADGIFARYLNCYDGYKGKKSALEFIHQQLLIQVTLGNGLLEFSDIAPRYFSVDEMREFLTLACDQRPDLWQSWVCMAEFCDQRGSYDEAMTFANEGVSRFPLIPRMWVERARIQKTNSRLPDAVLDYRKAVELSPGWIVAITSLADTLEIQGEFDQAYALIDKALEKMPEDGALLGYKAEALWRHGEKRDAIDLIERALTASHNHDWAWGRLRAWREEMAEPQCVLEFTQRLAEKNPSISTLWARCHLESKEAGQKLEFIRKAIALQPKNVDYLLDECSLLLEAGDLKLVREKIDASNWKGDRPSVVASYEAWLCWRMGDQALALKKMQTLTELDPTYLAAWRYLSHWYRVVGRVEDGLKSVRRCVELCPRDASVLANASEYLWSVEKPEGKKCDALQQEGLEYLERALSVDPASEALQVRVLDAYIDSDAFAKAGELLSVHASVVTSPYVMARQMNCMLHNGEIKNAMLVYEKMLISDEANQWVAERGVALSIRFNCLTEVEKVIDTSVADGSANAVAGFAWAALQIHRESDSYEISKRLHEFQSATLYWPSAVRSVMQCEDVDVVDKGNIIARYRPRFIELPELRDCAMWFMSSRRDWRSVENFGRRICGFDDNSMASLYLYNFALRLKCAWVRSALIVTKALACEEDHTLSNVMLWNDMDVAMKGGLTEYSLVRIDVDELTILEKFVYEYLRQIKAMREIPIQQNMSRYKKQFMQIKHDYPQIYMDPGVIRLRAALRKAILRMIPGGFWAKVFWYVRLLSVV